MNEKRPMYREGYEPNGYGGIPMPPEEEMGGGLPYGYGQEEEDEAAPAWARRLEERLDRIEMQLDDRGYDGFGSGDYEGGDSEDFPGYGDEEAAPHAEAYGQMHPQQHMAIQAIGQMMRDSVEDQLVKKVAGDLSTDAQAFVRDQLKGLDAFAIARVAQSPQIIAFLQRAARMEHYDRSGPQKEAPEAEGVWHGGEPMDGDAGKEIEAYLKAFGPLGVTKDMAIKAYQRATGGRR